MSTNYYLHYNEEVVGECCACGQAVKKQKVRHLGKSSGGWHFALKVYPDEGITDKDSLEKEIDAALQSGGCIRDEYEDEVDSYQFWKVVTHRAKPFLTKYPNEFYRSRQDFLDRNSAEDGFNGLVRAKLSRHCIGHGDGTYDYFVGDFS